MAYRPSCSTRITGVLRTLPLYTPRLVTITTGKPVSRSVVPRIPPELSYSSTWSRTQAFVLGSYSPSTGMPIFNTRRLPGTRPGGTETPGNECCTWSGRRDLNPGPSVPQTDTLTKLRHVPPRPAVVSADAYPPRPAGSV